MGYRPSSIFRDCSSAFAIPTHAFSLDGLFKQAGGQAKLDAYLAECGKSPMVVSVAPGIEEAFGLFHQSKPEQLKGLEQVVDYLRKATGRPVMVGHGGYWNRFEFEKVPMVSKAQVMALTAGDSWLAKGANILLFGPPGGGSHPAAALAFVVEAGWRELFTSTIDLVQRLQVAAARLALEAALTAPRPPDFLMSLLSHQSTRSPRDSQARAQETFAH